MMALQLRTTNLSFGASKLPLSTCQCFAPEKKIGQSEPTCLALGIREVGLRPPSPCDGYEQKNIQELEMMLKNTRMKKIMHAEVCQC